MSSIKDRAKMFSNNPGKEKGLKKDLIPKKENKEEEVNEEIISLAKPSWSKKKIFIVVGIATFIIVAIVITIIIIVVSSKSSSSSSPSEQNNPNDPSKQKQDWDSKDKEDSKETEIDSFIKPDCTGVCSKPYDILVYSDNKLKAKLKECGYTEGSQLFTYALSAIKRHNILRACHNANPLMFNCEIMKISQDYSQYLAKEVGSLIHSNTKSHAEWMGENLAYIGGTHLNPTGETPTNYSNEYTKNVQNLQ